MPDAGPITYIHRAPQAARDANNRAELLHLTRQLLNVDPDRHPVKAANLAAQIEALKAKAFPQDGAA